MPRCSKCQKPYHRNGYCSDCAKEYKRENYSYERERLRKIKQVYGDIAVEDYKRLYELQEGNCACCGLPEQRRTSAGRRAMLNTPSFSPLVIDHDHKTGRIRGLLCNACNQALGHLQEDPGRVKSLLCYINNNVLSAARGEEES